uniref:Uncharacterized protein n=1 Tax=Siphoviridae sp. ctkKt3 TaxID=2825642 RepID=A0A8S5UYR6_9CAUD|nr:MAG TPA: hypothetical protein [Siphoviridae sp. ctkKt3]
MYKFEEIFTEYIVPALVSAGTTLILVVILRLTGVL